MNTNNTVSTSKHSQTSQDYFSCPFWRKKLRVSCFVATLLLTGSPWVAQALSKLPFYEDFRYTNGVSLKSLNGWNIYSNAPNSGVPDYRYHGWQGVPGGKATASNEQGRVSGVSLLRSFGDYTGQPGVGWPTTSGKYDKASLVTMCFDYEPATGYIQDAEPTVWSKYGRMYSATRWYNENRGSYYKMMTTVRWFVKKDGLVSAYNGHRIKHLTHEPITNRTTIVVTADYQARKWSLWIGEQQVVTNFMLHATHAGTDMIHADWYKDYDGLKEVGLIDASTNNASLFDQVRIYEGTRATSSMPLMEPFETRVVGGVTITVTNGILNGQAKWFATNATVSASAQSTSPFSVGTQGVVLTNKGECIQLFLDQQTDVWTDLWLKPIHSGNGSTTVDAGGLDAVVRVDTNGNVVAFNGASGTVVTNISVTAWTRFTIHSDYNAGIWGLLVNGHVVASGFAFNQAVAGDAYREVRISVSGTAVAYLDDVAISTVSPFDLPSVSFDTDTLAVGENAVNVTVTARLSHSVLQSVSVGYLLNAGTATPTTDFTASNGTLVFAPGETVKTFSFTVVNDIDNEEGETLSFRLTDIENAIAGTYTTLTYTIAADPADFFNIPFEEPFEYRTLGNLQGQNGWLATFTTVQTNDTYGSSQKAAQGVRIASELSHAFSNGAHRVVTDWRAKPVFAQHAPIVPSQASYAFYVSTNGHVVAFNGTTATDLGGSVVLTQGVWAHFSVVTDHTSHTWSLTVNDSLLAQDLGFYSTTADSYTRFAVTGPVTIDDISITYNVPLEPTGLAAEGLDAQVLLDWQAAQGSTAYHVKRATVQGGPYSMIATTNATHWTDTTALNDTTYYYVVSADNSSGEGLNSLEATATPRRAVTGFEAFGGISTVRLAWNTYSGATNYVLQRAASSGGPYGTVFNVSATNFIDDTVLNDETYYYVINAQTSGYVSTTSDEVTATPSYRTIFYDSFETPVVTGRTSPGTPGWSPKNTSNGLWNEDSTRMVTPWGAQAAWIYSMTYIQTTNITEALRGGATYKLSVNVASEIALGDIKYKLELLAGTNVLNAVTAAFVVDNMDFGERSETMFFTAPTNSPYLGQPLGIRLSYASGAWQYVIGFDNVRLSTDIPSVAVLPNPLSFAVAPAPLPPGSITMTATAITNGVTPISYYFENTTNGNTSGWIPRATWTNTALVPGVIYGYRVKARDVYGNQVAWSPVATTYIVDSETPTPDPAQFAVVPWKSAPGEASMTAVTATDACGSVSYFFENVTANRNSGWISNATWTDVGLVVGQTYSFRVKVRDHSPARNETSWSVTTNLYVVGASYTVALDQQTGTGGTPSVTATVALPMPAATGPTRYDYLFGGYYTEVSGGGTQYYTETMTSARNWDIDAATTLYAKWTKRNPEIMVIRSDVPVPNGGYDAISGTAAGSGMQLNYSITNIGNVTLTLANAVTSGVHNCSVAINTPSAASLEPDASTNLVVTVTPAATGAWSFMLSMVTNDEDHNPAYWTVHGMTDSSTAAPEMRVSRGLTVVADDATDTVTHTIHGVAVQLTYTIANLGNATLVLTNQVAVAPVSNCVISVNIQPGSPVAPSAETNLVLTITPTMAGTWAATVSVANNDPNKDPYNWTMSGTTEPDYTITFDQQGGSGGSNSVLVTRTFEMPEATAPNRTGYTFGGYYTATDGAGTQYYTAAMASARNWDIALDTTLYAQWTGNNYTVTFNANSGDTPSPTNKVVTYDAPYGTLATVTRTGYTFNGWFTTPTGGTQISSGTTVAITTDQTLYAQWSVNSYTVTFDGNGGATPAPTSKSVTYDALYDTLATVTRTGYTFTGWFTAPTGGTPISSDTTVAITVDQTLYAQWTANSYTVTFDGNSGETPAPTSKSVSYDATYGTLSTVTRTGYTFTGWFTAPSGGSQVTSVTTVLTAADHSLYAQWSINSYQVAYNGNGNTGGTTPTNSVYEYGTLITVLGNVGNLVKTGHSFTSWNTALDGSGISYAPEATFTLTGHTTLYARWTPDTYTVNYLANGATGGEAPTNQTKIYNVALTLAANSGSLVKTDYSLLGWNTAADGSGVTYAGGATYTNNAPLTLYARWLSDTSLTWDSDGATAGVNNGSGHWQGSNRWWSAVLSTNQSWVTGKDAIFGGVGTTGSAGIITNSAPVTIRSLTFGAVTSGGFTIGSAGQTMTLNSGIYMSSNAPAVTISSPLQLGEAQTWTNNSANTLAVNSGLNNGGSLLTIDGSGSTTFGNLTTLSGAGGLTKNGTGNLNLNGVTVSISGNLVINAGQVMAGSMSIGTGNLTINDGVLVDYWGGTLSRTLGETAGQVQILGGTSGLCGQGTTGLTVKFNNSTTYEVVWGSTYFSPTTLVLQSPWANVGGNMTWQNPLDLRGATRTILVNKDHGGANGYARMSGVIRNNGGGTAGLIKSGPGKLILSANNTYNGSTTISAGIVDFENITLGFGSGRDISAAEGVIVMRTALNNAFLNRLVETSNEFTLMTGSTANNLDFSSSTGANLPGVFLGNWSSSGAKMEYSGTLTPASDAYRLGGKGSSGLLGIVGANKLTGAQGLIVGGTGGSGIRVELAAAQSFTGDTVINTGAKLILGNNLALQNSVLDVGSAGGTFALSDGTNSGRITGDVASPCPTFGGLKGTRNLLSAFTSSASANETLLAASAVTNFTLNLGEGKSCTYSGTIANFATGMTLTKGGLGTQILAGTNTYTGATAINQGKLAINGSLSNVVAELSVASGATLGGTGTIGRNVTIASGGKLEFEISTAAASHDGLTISTGRDFVFSGASELTIISTNGATPGTYILITGGNNISGVAPSTVNMPAAWDATVSISTNSLVLTLNAIGPVMYSMTYNENGATAGSSPVDGGSPYLKGTTVSVLGNTGALSKTGYTFAAWNTATNGSGTSYAPAATFTIMTNTTLYVQWTPNNYTVTFTGNGGGTPTPASSPVTYDATYGALATVTRAGYTFNGWFTAASGGTQITSGTTVAITADQTLYAQWTPDTYTVTFNANGGNMPSPANKSVTYGATYGALATVTRAGYTLNGWFTAASGGTQITSGTTVAITAEQTLYAQWAELFAPTALSATAISSTQIDLAWTDNSSDETGFLVERSTTNGLGFVAIGATEVNVTNYTDSTVNAGETWYYRVISTNATTSSMPSAEASVTTPKLPATINLESLFQTYDSTTRAVTYTTSPTGLVVTVTYNGGAIAPTNVGTYAVTGTVVSATYEGSTNGILTVTAKNVSTLTVERVSPFTYDGTAQSPEPQVTDGAAVLSKDTNYSLAYTANTNAGHATVTVTGIGNYEGTTNTTFTINQATLAVTPTAGHFKIFGGVDPVLTYTNTGAVAGETAAFSGALSRASGETAGSYAITQGTLALADNGAFTASNYALSFTTGVTFTITAKDAATLTIADSGPFAYDGTAKTPQPEVRDGTTVLAKDTDYTLSYAANTHAGSATVTVTGINNYTGTQDKTFTISPATLTVTPDSGQSKLIAAADPALAFTNSAAMAGETAAFSGALSRASGETAGSYAITQGTLALADNGAFTASNYALSFTTGVTFTITAKDAATLTIADIAPTAYDGTAKTPQPEVKDGETVLAKGVDYTLSYANNVNAGTATLTVTGINNYTGTQNKNFTITKATPTVNTWPTGTIIVVGQALSNSTLSAGSASVPGTFSFDAPSTVPPVGVCTAAVTFAATDSVNYQAVAGTAEVLVNPLPPSEPASPIATPSLGQAALSWTASAGATGYHVKRASSPGGPYVTLGSTNNTSYVDTTAINGSTYYYVITAFNTGGESGDSAAVSAVIPYGLPFAENFESLIVGSLNTQNGWSAVDANVQTNTVKTGAKAASITSGTGYLQHTFAGADTNVWTDFVLQPVFFESAPSLSDPVGTVNLYFNTNGHPVVYNNTTPVELTTVTVTTGAWVRVTVRSDYVARKWDLYINNTAVASGLSFYTAAPLVYTSFKVSGAGVSSVALDDLLIGLLPPWPSKGTFILFHF